jgi:hypothetical protein
MSLVMAVLALMGVALLGFVAGLLIFNIKNRRCPQAGLTLRCPDCAATKSVSSVYDVQGGWR